MMQYRHLVELALDVGGSFTLILGDDEYSAATEAELAYSPNGNVYPQVSIDEIRTTIEAGKSRVPYMVKFVSGFGSSPEEET